MEHPYGWRDRFNPKFGPSSSPQESAEESLRSVIHNLRCVIAKQEATIERLLRQLAEERASKITNKGENSA